MIKQQIKEITFQEFKLTKEEQYRDDISKDRNWVSSGPEFEEFKNKLMNATFQEIPSKISIKTQTISVPQNMLDKLEKLMQKAKIPYTIKTKKSPSKQAVLHKSAS